MWVVEWRDRQFFPNRIGSTSWIGDFHPTTILSGCESSQISKGNCCTFSSGFASDKSAVFHIVQIVLISTWTTNTIDGFHNNFTGIIFTFVAYIAISIKVEKHIIYTDSESAYTTIGAIAWYIGEYILLIAIGSIYFSSIYKSIATFRILVSRQWEILVGRGRIIRVIHCFDINSSSYLSTKTTTYRYISCIDTIRTLVKIHINIPISISCFQPIHRWISFERIHIHPCTFCSCFRCQWFFLIICRISELKFIICNRVSRITQINDISTRVF